MMKKSFVSLMILTCLVLMGMSCKQKQEVTNAPETSAVSKMTKVCLLVTGNLGDRSFFDSANEGIKRLNTELSDKIETRVVEVGPDQSKYGPALQQISNEDYDIIVVMGWIVVEHLQDIAPEHPEKTYIIMDSAVDYSNGNCNNVFSVEYKSNEASFLAGALATKLTVSGLPEYDTNSQIGFIGAIDIPVINDFMVGYIEGARYINQNVKCSVSYIGSFDDSAKAKELGLTGFRNGADIIFAPASAATIGIIDAGFETNHKVIGVDSDMAVVIADTSPDRARGIPTSVLKNTGNSLYNSVVQYINGTLPVGKSVMHGLVEGGVGLAKNQYYEQLVPQAIRDEITDLEKKIISGEIIVSSAYGMDSSALNTLRNSVR
jgi:basic membrane protein A